MWQQYYRFSMRYSIHSQSIIYASFVAFSIRWPRILSLFMCVVLVGASKRKRKRVSGKRKQKALRLAVDAFTEFRIQHNDNVKYNLGDDKMYTNWTFCAPIWLFCAQANTYTHTNTRSKPENPFLQTLHNTLSLAHILFAQMQKSYSLYLATHINVENVPVGWLDQHKTS